MNAADRTGLLPMDLCLALLPLLDKEQQQRDSYSLILVKLRKVL